MHAVHRFVINAFKGLPRAAAEVGLHDHARRPRRSDLAADMRADLPPQCRLVRREIDRDGWAAVAELAKAGQLLKRSVYEGIQPHKTAHDAALAQRIAPALQGASEKIRRVGANQRARV